MLAPIAFQPACPTYTVTGNGLPSMQPSMEAKPFAIMTLRVLYSSPPHARFQCSRGQNVVRQTQRNSRSQIRQRVRQTLQQAVDMDFRWVKTKGSHRRFNGLRALQTRDPRRGRTSNQQQQTGRNTGKIGFLPNQLMKISNRTMKETVGASNACSIGFIASSSNPVPDRQDSSTVRGSSCGWSHL